jgi:HSP20 family molecular chaperone IbpA
MPAAIDADKIEAKHNDGIQEVNIPKAQTAKPKKISIKTGK